MKKLFIVTVAVVLVVMSGAAFATEARLTALGRDVAPYICDDANVYSWYATLPSYSNLLIVGLWNDWEYDDGDDVEAAFGLTYALGEDGAWGTLAIGLMENTPGPNQDSWMASEIWGWWDSRDIFDWSLYNRYMLMYGYQMEGMSFGLFFSRACEADKYESDYGDPYEQEWKEAYTTLGLGFRMDIGEDMVLDAAFDYTKASYLYTYTDIDADEEADPGKAMAFRARMFYNWREDITFVPYFDFSTQDFAYSPVDEFYSDEGYGFKTTAFKFGIGANMKVNEDNMILFAIEPFAYWKGEPSGYTDDYEDEWETTVKTMPKFILALESDLTDWLTFRTGCSKSLAKYGYSWSDADDSEEYWENYDSDFDPFTWNLGLGFHFGDFDIDCVLNKDVPFSMGYWLTGYQNNYDNETTPVGMISAVYHF
ncbi:MAG: hypothetical protein JW746_03540 [Candidatus Krumholzibacteriota bacterium]|nr:hypothetical protein [Candidatus Krumholzibacteriota bacterium]